MKKQDIQHVKIAVGSPQANGQIERINWVIAPCIAKLSDRRDDRTKFYTRWNILLITLLTGSLGKSPSQLVFDMNQRDPCVDHLKVFRRRAGFP